MSDIRRHFRISGRVQGVGFRYFTQRTADQVGVTGWVRNLGDGDVEAEAQGSSDAVERFTEALRKGPRTGHVRNLQTADRAPRDDESGFRIRH